MNHLPSHHFFRGKMSPSWGVCFKYLQNTNIIWDMILILWYCWKISSATCDVFSNPCLAVRCFIKTIGWIYDKFHSHQHPGTQQTNQASKQLELSKSRVVGDVHQSSTHQIKGNLLSLGGHVFLHLERLTGLAMVQKKTLCRKTVGLESKLYQGVNYNYDLEESCDPLKKSVIFRRKKKKTSKSPRDCFVWASAKQRLLRPSNKKWPSWSSKIHESHIPIWKRRVEWPR